MQAGLLPACASHGAFPAWGCEHTQLCLWTSLLGIHSPSMGRLQGAQSPGDRGEKQAARLDFDFNCLFVFSSLLARCQELSAGKRGLCVPCLASLMGTSPFSQQDGCGNGQEQGNELGTFRSSGDAEGHSFVCHSRCCCLSPLASLCRRHLGRR